MRQEGEKSSCRAQDLWEEGAGMGGGASPTRLSPLLSPWELVPLFLSLLKGNDKVRG